MAIILQIIDKLNNLSI